MTRDELKKKRIAVLMGGLSAEREISLRTGKAVSEALAHAGYSIEELDAGRDLPERLSAMDIDVAFIALHGRFGEDGTVQGLLEILRIPYTGSGVLASSLAMDKVMAKKIFLHHQLPTPGFTTLRRTEDVEVFEKRCRHFPVVVKPAREGSTIGIGIVRSTEALRGLVEKAFRHDDLILVEDFIEGVEVTVGVLNGEPLPMIQIVPRGGFYDYHAKYTAGETEYVIPAPLEKDLYGEIQHNAVVAYESLGCSGAARVDFKVRGSEFFCLEVNTIPGMTATSLLPKAAQHAGIPFVELVERILENATLDK